MRRIMISQGQNETEIIEADIDLDNTGDAYIHKVIIWSAGEMMHFNITNEYLADQRRVDKIWLIYANEMETERQWKAGQRYEDDYHGDKT